MNIHLIQPPISIGRKSPFICLPNSISVIANCLKQKGYTVSQYDMWNVSHGLNDAVGKLFEEGVDIRRVEKQIIGTGLFKNRHHMKSIRDIGEKMYGLIKPGRGDLIGISIHSYTQLISGLALANEIKRRIHARCVMGGAFISFFADIFFKYMKCVDYLIKGDGCLSFPELLGAIHGKIKLSEVPNLIYRKYGITRRNRFIATDINGLPLPDYSGLPWDVYAKKLKEEKGKFLLIPYEISSGCRCGCNFCITRKMYEYHIKSQDKVIDDLTALRNRYPDAIFFLCNCYLNISEEYIQGLCDIFIKRALKIKWVSYARVNNLSKATLLKLRQAGCIQLSFGVESGSNHILKAMNKGFSVKDAEETLVRTHEAGIKNVVFIITGYPFETDDDLSLTIQFLRQNREHIDYVSVYKFILFHGSDMHINPESHGLMNLRPRSHMAGVEFIFDEKGSLSWVERERFQKKSHEKITGVVNELYCPRHAEGLTVKCHL